VLRLNPLHAVRNLIPEPGPKQPYVLSSFINAFGFGLLIVAAPLYFTRIVGLSVAQVGLGLTIGVSAGLLVGVPIGHLADRRGPVQTAKAMLLLQFAVAIGFLFIHDFVTFVIIAIADTVALNAFLAANGAVLRRLAANDTAGFRALTYAIWNLGIALGTACSAIMIQLDTPAAFYALIIGNAVTFLVAWVILRRLPHYEPLPKPATASRWGVLADRAFVVYTALQSAMVLSGFMITLLLPLWVAFNTEAPRWCIPMFLLINTIMVVLLQVRIGKRVQTIRAGGVAMRRAGVIFLVSCSVIGFSAGVPGWVALILLVAGVCLHTFGLIWHAAATFALTYGLPPEHAQGQYVGFVLIGSGIGSAIAPVLLLGFVMSLGRPGLIGLGVFLALIGLLMPITARWGERTRPPAPDSADVPAVD
jgi:hypothetical protein